MPITTTTHINFQGQAQAALEFYREVFGGDVTHISYDAAQAVTEPAEANWIMWGQVVSAAGFNIMAFDVPAARPFDRGTASFFVSVRGESADEISGYWDNLKAGGTVLVPLAASGWSPLYGMLVDQFGVTWVLDVTVAHPQD